MEFYAKLSMKNVDKANKVVKALATGEDWYQKMDKQFGDVWEEFVVFWKKTTGKETPQKMSFYASHNAHWIAEWASKKHPELMNLPE